MSMRADFVAQKPGSKTIDKKNYDLFSQGQMPATAVVGMI